MLRMVKRQECTPLINRYSEDIVRYLRETLRVEINNSTLTIMMAGWDVEQSVAAIDGVLSLAAASGEDLALVSDIVTDGMTAFGLAADQAGRFSDVLASASSNANTNVAMLGESFKYVAPVAGALGYSIEDTALALGLMANAGIKSSQAGTALRASLTNLVKPTKAMKNEMDALGINVKDANGEMKPMETLLRDLRTSFSTLTDDQKASAAATIFGKEAMAGMLAILNASEEDFNKLSKSINESEGAAKQMADTMQDNLQGQLTNLKSAMEELMIKIYEGLEPALKAIVQGAQGLVDKLNSMSPAMQKVAIGVGVLLASLGPLLTIGGTLLVGVGQFMTMLPVLTPLIAGLAVPIGIVVGALGVLAAAYALTRTEADDYLTAQQRAAEAELEVAKANTLAKEEMLANMDATSKKASATLEAIEANGKLVDSYESLKAKMKLSNDELLEFKTLNSELSMTTSDVKINEIKDRMEELRKKSGLSNEEFNNFLSTNDALAEKLPESALKFDEYGNAIINVTDNIKDLTQAELDRVKAEVYEEMLADLQEVSTELETQALLIDDIITKEAEQEQMAKDLAGYSKELTELEAEKLRINSELNGLKENATLWDKITYGEYTKQKDELIKQSVEVDKKLEKTKKNKDVLSDTLETEKLTLDELKKQNSQNNDLVKKTNEQRELLIKIVAQQTGINLEKGKELQQLDQAIKAKDTEISKLQEQKRLHGDKNGEIQKQIQKYQDEKKLLQENKGELSNIITKNEDVNNKVTEGNKELAKRRVEHQKNGREIDNNKKKAQEENKELGKKIDKNVNVKTSKDADDENKKWSKPISKIISFFTKGEPKAYAKGTNYHPGGPAFLGEEGPELVKVNGKTSLATFGLYDLPRGAKVWTNKQSMEILRSGLVDDTDKGAKLSKTNFSTRENSSKGNIVYGDTHITVNATVREDADAQRIAKEIKSLEKREQRFKGVM